MILNQNIRKKIQDSTYDLVLRTTSHGLPNIFHTKRTSLKIMWIILFIGSTTASIYFVLDSILDFLAFDFITSISIIYEQQTEFPTISFCSNRTEFGNRSIRSIITFCKFQGVDTCYRSPELLFDNYTDGLYGTCYRFNNGKNMLGVKLPIWNATLEGNLLGFRATFRMDPNAYLILKIHNRTKTPTSLANKESVLTIGGFYNFKIEKVISQKLALPYNECYKNASQSPNNKTFINLIKLRNSEYTRQECFELCYSYLYLKNSNCDCVVNTLYDVVNKCFFSSNTSLTNCSNLFLYYTLNSQTYDICQSYCPLECDSIDYQITSTTALNHLNDSVDINVFFESLKYTFITESPKMKLFDLISSIGGILGLFIGISFLSFFEILEIFLEIVFIILDNIKSINKVQPFQ